MVDRPVKGRKMERKRCYCHPVAQYPGAISDRTIFPMGDRTAHGDPKTLLRLSFHEPDAGKEPESVKNHFARSTRI